jgi:putative tryptophan/tyrosine transport system substrate-binding protein
MLDIGRRDFIALIGGATAAWPLAAHAQQPRMPLIGYLHPATPDTSMQTIAAFHQGLRETGYVEGNNIGIEYRWAEGRNNRLPALAANLASRPVAAIAAPGGDSSAFALKAATTAIPIVSLFASDPVKNGLVASLNRPGGNITGVVIFSAELMPKRLELLCEAVPNAIVIDALVNPEGAITAESTKALEASARSLRRQIRIHAASNDPEIDATFAELIHLRTSALLVMADSFFSSRMERIGALTLRSAIPAMSARSEFVTGGGLMSYDINRSEAYRLVGTYIGRILKGEKPADLPVQQATKMELILNLKTARTLGLVIPPALLARADELIE